MDLLKTCAALKTKTKDTLKIVPMAETSYNKNVKEKTQKKSLYYLLKNKKLTKYIHLSTIIHGYMNKRPVNIKSRIICTLLNSGASNSTVAVNLTKNVKKNLPKKMEDPSRVISYQREVEFFLFT